MGWEWRVLSNIPDLRGYFLRGVDADRRDPSTLAVDKNPDARFAINDLPGGKLEERSAARAIGNKIGSYQSFATARPQGDPRIGQHNYFKTLGINCSRTGFTRDDGRAPA